MTDLPARDQLRSFVERIDEKWMPIAGYPGYEISDLGRVRSHKGGAPVIMKGGPGTTPMRYRRVTLTRKDGKRLSRNIHVIVAETFIGPRPPNKLALHKDGEVNNCKLSNIYWGSRQDNANDCIAHGRSGKHGDNPNAKLDNDRVSKLREAYASGNVTQAQLAAVYGVRQAHVSRIVRGFHWPEDAA